MSASTRVRVAGLFVGQARPLQPEGQPSAIDKQRVDGVVAVTLEGLSGDAQADRRVHGGAEKAVHQFALESYAALKQAYPGQAGAFEAGSIGENISASDMTEATVCIGDIYSIDEVRLQVSQPRSPCWKIDARYGIERLSRFVQEQRISGWYYRVLAPGEMASGAEIRLLERSPQAISVREFWDIYLQHRPQLRALERLLAIEGLNLDWHRKIADRLAWLARHGGT